MAGGGSRKNRPAQGDVRCSSNEKIEASQTGVRTIRGEDDSETTRTGQEIQQLLRRKNDVGGHIFQRGGTKDATKDATS